MSEAIDDERWVLLDASVAITLARIDAFDVVLGVRGTLVLPEPVESEITSEAARSSVERALEADTLETRAVEGAPVTAAAEHLGREPRTDDPTADSSAGDEHATVDGDVALLAIAMQRSREATMDDPVVAITDDKPLRNTCKTLSIPVSGSIGVLVRAVERADLDRETATEKLYAMDEVGARLSASLVRKAERSIDEAAEK